MLKFDCSNKILPKKVSYSSTEVPTSTSLNLAHLIQWDFRSIRILEPGVLEVNSPGVYWD